MRPFWKFPGNPVVRTPHFTERGAVWSLVGPVRSHMLRDTAKELKRKKEKKESDHFE